MINDIKKSIKATLYERTASPFYGAFIISWVVWNWKIIYLTLFVSEKILQQSKLECIDSHYQNYRKLLFFPLLSALFFTLNMPYMTNWIFGQNLKFKQQL